MDSRIEGLSRQLTEYSCDLKAGERVLIEYEGARMPAFGAAADQGCVSPRRQAICSGERRQCAERDFDGGRWNS